VVDEAALIDEAAAFARKIARGPTRAHAAHKALLRALGGGRRRGRRRGHVRHRDALVRDAAT
jgi:enoyl-CoA hydratase/carnithine racemase